ncbi:MAG TPA: GspH/FimT family pseudopilin [Thermoanaerobaculia bacterium]|jgi:type II secretory pathway pseudopilin PulG|nr:GspH/FimT family pseudopilin [Thermoanaerobaculia bacterium]
MRHLRCFQKGFQLVEMVVALTILGTLIFLSLPPFLRITGDLRLRLTANEVMGILRAARSFAIRHGANVAVQFKSSPEGAILYALYRDGDGDGVLTKDIAKRVDPAVQPPHSLDQAGGRSARLGFPPGLRVRDPGSPGKWLTTADPIRFNSSDLASFGPLGTSTPGSLYLTDGHSRLAVVRVLGRTGRVRVMAYDFVRQVWQ